MNFNAFQLSNFIVIVQIVDYLWIFVSCQLFFSIEFVVIASFNEFQFLIRSFTESIVDFYEFWK